MNAMKIKLNPNLNPISTIVTPIPVLFSVGIAVPLSDFVVLPRIRAVTVLPTVSALVIEVLVFPVVELRELVVAAFAGILLEAGPDTGPPATTKGPTLGGGPPPTVYTTAPVVFWTGLTEVSELPEIEAVMTSTIELLESLKEEKFEVSVRPYGR